MKINYNTQPEPSFNGLYIKTARITKSNNINQVNFILLNNGNRSDIEAIQTIAKTWDKPSFTNTIATGFSWTGILENKSQMKYYVITEQQKNFENLNPDKILAIAETEEIKPKKIILHHLQVKPQFQNLYKPDSKYKGIGTSILKSLQSIYNKIVLKTVADIRVKNFYKHNGFRASIFDEERFSWNLNIYKRIKRILGYND